MPESKRKLCNGENFRIKDIDKFRLFWRFLSQNNRFLNMYGLYWTYRLKPQPHRHWPFIAPAESPLRITSRERPQLFSFSTFSVSSLCVTGNRCCWSPRLPALLLLFSESLHNGCGETADRRPLLLRRQH